MVKAAREALKVIIDGLGSLSPLFELMAQLQYVSATWFCVNRGESTPYLSCCSRCRQERLNGGGDGSKQCAVDQLILALLLNVSVIGVDNTIFCHGGWWDFGRSINVAGKGIAIEERVDLATPHNEVCSREFSDIVHVDMKHCRVVRDIDGLNGLRRHDEEDRRLKKKRKRGGDEEDEVDG